MERDDRFIHQIDFYCDLWCERCPLSASCFQYSVVDSAEDFADRQKKSILQMRKLWLTTARRLGVQVKPNEFFQVAMVKTTVPVRRPVST